MPSGDCEHRRGAHHEVHTGGHHRGRVDEGRHRGGAFHCVGEPEVQRQLCALANGTNEQHQRNHRGGGLSDTTIAGCFVERAVAERSERLEREEHCDHEAPVANSVGDERFLASGGGRLAAVPETDEQVRAGAHTFPTEERNQHVLAEHQHEHAEHEQVEVQEELAELGITVHVPNGVQVDQRSNAGDEQRHRDRQRISKEGKVNLEVACRNPTEQGVHVRTLFSGLRKQIDEHADGDQERRRCHQRGDIASAWLTQLAAKEQHNEESCERQGRDQPNEVEHVD